MAVAWSISNLGGHIKLFWTGFDPIVTVVPLKVALGWHKFCFWVFQKNNQESDCPVTVHDYFFEMSKNQRGWLLCDSASN